MARLSSSEFQDPNSARLVCNTRPPLLDCQSRAIGASPRYACTSEPAVTHAAIQASVRPARSGHVMPPSASNGVPRLGIIGGGQLGQMLTLAAIDLGIEVTVFERAADSPAGR